MWVGALGALGVLFGGEGQERWYEARGALMVSETMPSVCLAISQQAPPSQEACWVVTTLEQPGDHPLPGRKVLCPLGMEVGWEWSPPWAWRGPLS